MPENTSAAPSAEELKRLAAVAAVDAVSPGMKLGIGTGSTAEQFVIALAKRVREGLSIVGVPTSERTHRLASDLGIPMATLEDQPVLDLTVDGADELDGQLRLIKGGGGALLREKIVASASRRMIVIADGSKLVTELGAYPLPIEVVPFGLAVTRLAIEALADRLGLAGPITLRKAGNAPYLTDGGHFILDASFGRIPDPEALAAGLTAIPGVVEHGLFIGLASEAILARPDGIVRVTAGAPSPSRRSP